MPTEKTTSRRKFMEIGAGALLIGAATKAMAVVPCTQGTHPLIGGYGCNNAPGAYNRVSGPIMAYSRAAGVNFHYSVANHAPSRQAISDTLSSSRQLSTNLQTTGSAEQLRQDVINQGPPPMQFPTQQQVNLALVKIQPSMPAVTAQLVATIMSFPANNPGADYNMIYGMMYDPESWLGVWGQWQEFGAKIDILWNMPAKYFWCGPLTASDFKTMAIITGLVANIGLVLDRLSSDPAAQTLATTLMLAAAAAGSGLMMCME